MLDVEADSDTLHHDLDTLGDRPSMKALPARGAVRALRDKAD